MTETNLFIRRMRIGLIVALLLEAILVLAITLYGLRTFSEVAKAAEGTRTALTIKIDGFHNDKGQVVVALYDSKKAYADDKPCQTVKTTIRDGHATAILSNISPGTYVVGVLHDENNNGELDKNFFGKPKEGVGLSNNPRISLMHEPTWEECRFQLGDADNTLELKVKYL